MLAVFLLAAALVLEGPVGSRLLGRSPLFRYEIRRWGDGTIPDVAEAVAGPHVVSADATQAQEVLRLTPLVPALVWGRDFDLKFRAWDFGLHIRQPPRYGPRVLRRADRGGISFDTRPFA
ncbi:hypothetical protein [Actinoplanes auranticolor]|uniref:Uncharacterized protein n=1 Tax=Actinoplanes auranticolor TaxID=47988 RepID=A0A919SYT7_9ACTN|nr:hypothetical protein [Actinoplanes auranticolor]GIM80534.1 hypothetical protein Aau02nite_91030 [Actinoplanes auranticolor]